MLMTRGDEKYDAQSLLAAPRDWATMRVEHRQIASGPHNPSRVEYTELLHVISGKALVRHGAGGRVRERMALPGTSWLVPAGIDESVLETDGSTECLIIYLPAQLLGDTAMVEFGVAPERAGLVYEGGFVDPTLTQLSLALRGLLARPRQPIDQLFAEGARAMVSAHLVANYNVDQWRPASRQPMLDRRRLQRVLDYIDAHLDESMSLDRLASEACLSPFHFARLFREATGLSPHRFVTERRIAGAQEMMIAGGKSLAEVALDAGFGSQAHFCRVFRKATGLSPRAYRELHRGRAVTVVPVPNGNIGQERGKF
jgi:AraC family transcriptional regulator